MNLDGWQRSVCHFPRGEVPETGLFMARKGRVNQDSQLVPVLSPDPGHVSSQLYLHIFKLDGTGLRRRGRPVVKREQ